MEYGSLIYKLRDGRVQKSALRVGSATLGSAPENDVVLDAEGVSRYHARILCIADGCWITDLGSTNGTYLNQQRLVPNIRQRLNSGDKLRIGPFVLLYTVPNQPGDPQTQTTAGPLAPPEPAPAPPRPAILPPEVAAKLPPTAEAPSYLTGSPPARPRIGGGGPPRIPPGRRRLAAGPSSYMQYLPPCYHGDPFLGNFLLIFESILDPLDRMVNQIPLYFDPATAPEPMLRWLASWLDLVLDETWPIERRRALVRAAADLYRWRGTRRGLREYIRIYTGVEPRIIEPGQEQAAGIATLPSHVFRVILQIPDEEQARAALDAIIMAEKPAHTSYILEIRSQ